MAIEDIDALEKDLLEGQAACPFSGSMGYNAFKGGGGPSPPIVELRQHGASLETAVYHSLQELFTRRRCSRIRHPLSPSASPSAGLASRVVLGRVASVGRRGQHTAALCR